MVMAWSRSSLSKPGYLLLGCSSQLLRHSLSKILDDIQLSGNARYNTVVSWRRFSEKVPYEISWTLELWRETGRIALTSIGQPAPTTSEDQGSI